MADKYEEYMVELIRLKEVESVELKGELSGLNSALATYRQFRGQGWVGEVPPKVEK